jgi:hypothetical protein
METLANYYNPHLMSVLAGARVYGTNMCHRQMKVGTNYKCVTSMEIK